MDLHAGIRTHSESTSFGTSVKANPRILLVTVACRPTTNHKVSLSHWQDLKQQCRLGACPP